MSREPAKRDRVQALSHNQRRLTVKLLAGRLGVLALTASILAISASPSRAQNLAAAQDTFKTFCVKCHGASGRGDGPAGATLEVKPGDLTDCARMAKVSDDVVFKVIKEGGSSAGLSKAMAGFGEGLDDDEIKGLVSYVRSFCKK